MTKNIADKIWSNDLIKTGVFTGSATAFAMLAGLVLNKIIAISVGPAGLAAVSQFKNFISIASFSATAGIKKGVVKYAAEYSSDENKLGVLLSTAIWMAIVPSVIIGGLVFLTSGLLSEYLFETRNYGMALRLFGLSLVLFSLNILLMSILNGTGEIQRLVKVKYANSFFTLAVTGTATWFFGLKGALYSLAISQAVVVILTTYLVVSCQWFKKELFTRRIEPSQLRLLLGFGLMALSSMVVPPFVKVEIRNFIIANLSITDAGYWDASFAVSAAYLNVITTTLAIYYLPKLSALTGRKEIRNEIWNGYKVILPTLALMLAGVYFFREQIIILLYTEDFLDMEYLFMPMLIGDFLRVASFVLSYLMLAKAMVALFITTELVFSAITYLLSIFMISKIGLEGVMWAHAIKYLLYLLLVMVLFRKYVMR